MLIASSGVLRTTFPRFACLAAALIAVAGCGARDDRGTRVGVRGAVFLDGKPLNRSIIVFRAAEGESKVVATAPIVDGFYEIPAERGPLAGKVRVEIRPDQIEMEEFEAARKENPRHKIDFEAIHIPAKYNTRSELVREVSAESEENKFDFLLTSE